MGGYQPLEAVFIQQPYHDIYQFSACVFDVGDGETAYPTELEDYAPCYAALYEDMRPCLIFN